MEDTPVIKWSKKETKPFVSRQWCPRYKGHPLTRCHLNFSDLEVDNNLVIESVYFLSAQFHDDDFPSDSLIDYDDDNVDDFDENV